MGKIILLNHWSLRTNIRVSRVTLFNDVVFLRLDFVTSELLTDNTIKGVCIEQFNGVFWKVLSRYRNIEKGLLIKETLLLRLLICYAGDGCSKPINSNKVIMPFTSNDFLADMSTPLLLTHINQRTNENSNNRIILSLLLTTFFYLY